MSSASARAPGQKIGVYVLLEKLGSGGLGEVWKARDPRLNRVVSLKFLSVERAGEPPRELLREARAASALNHPNIVTIFEVGESEGQTYLAMEFIEGETLRARLGRPPVSLEEALDIATQAATGLAAAHRHGIVHRDLKPENIMLRADGFVKLVDFGLAKALPWSETSTADVASDRTESGHLVGTFTYMAPEQARAQSATPASDVFAWGIVFYEVFTREHPFRADSAMDTLAAILNQLPQPVSARAPAVPPQISDIVGRALEKEPSRRYPSGVELVEELRRARTVQVPPPAELPSTVHARPRWMKAVGGVLIATLLGTAGWFLRPGQFSRDGEVMQGMQVQTVAVANFAAQPGDSAAEMIAQSLPDDLSSALAAAGLRVSSRSSVMAQTASADPRDLGMQLGVDAVLAGNVRSFGPRLRIHVELVSTRTGFQIWSGSFTTESGDLLTSGQKTAEEIAAQLRAALAGRR